MRLRPVSSFVVVGGAGLVGGVLALALWAGSAAAMRGETGKLAFHGELSWRGQTADCPSGTPSTVVCREHVGAGVVPGLGPVTERYLFLGQTGTTECPGSWRVLGLSGRFTVANKGTIDITTAPSTDCQPEEQNATLNFPSATITGGSGSYAGASGSGTLRETLSHGVSAFGKDTWEMTLLVPGLAFDTTPPVLRGAVTKTVLAARGVKLVRITYRVTALDETDGSVPVACTPRTGSRFKVGRTLVNCSATDKSGNTGRARFTVTVRARR